MTTFPQPGNVVRITDELVLVPINADLIRALKMYTPGEVKPVNELIEALVEDCIQRLRWSNYAALARGKDSIPDPTYLDRYKLEGTF